MKINFYVRRSNIAEMEEFIEHIKMLVNTLGHKVFDEKREFKPKHKQEIFFIKAARGADGQGKPISDGFVVFKNSKAAATIVMGRNANGLTEWKTKNGKTLKDVESNEKVITPKE